MSGASVWPTKMFAEAERASAPVIPSDRRSKIESQIKQGINRVYNEYKKGAEPSKGESDEDEDHALDAEPDDADHAARFLVTFDGSGVPGLVAPEPADFARGRVARARALWHLARAR